MLNVVHVKNYVKWRPIVTKFGTLIENMSRTGLYDRHIFLIFIDNFMRISNFGIVLEFYMLKSNIDVFLWRHFSARSSLYCFIK